MTSRKNYHDDLTGDLFADYAGDYSKHTDNPNFSAGSLNNLTAESAEGHVPNIKVLNAIVHITSDYRLLDILAAEHNCKLLRGNDTIYAEIAKLKTQEQDIANRRKALEQRGGKDGKNGC